MNSYIGVLAITLVIAAWAIAPASANHLEAVNLSCVVENNFSIIPSGILTLAVQTNSSTNFLIQSVLHGECNMVNVTINTTCEWCSFSDQKYNQTHGSNKPINTLVFVPPLHPNDTDKLYAFNFTITGEPNVTQANFTLFVYVPFSDAFVNASNLTIPKFNITFDQVITIIEELPRENQLQIALALNQIFENLNFSFIVKVREEIERQVPQIVPVPLNVEEFKKWQLDCNQLVREQLTARVAELEGKYNESVERIRELKGNEDRLKQESKSCQEEKEATAFAAEEKVKAAEDTAENQQADSDATLTVVFLIVIGAMFFYFWRTKYGSRKNKRKVHPGGSGPSTGGDDTDNGDDEESEPPKAKRRLIPQREPATPPPPDPVDEEISRIEKKLRRSG